jgi:hypothetical protein
MRVMVMVKATADSEAGVMPEVEMFAETKELLAGFWLWRVESMDQAIEWLKRCPNPMPGESEIEIRPVFEAEDFAPVDPTGEHREAERRLRAEIQG